MVARTFRVQQSALRPDILESICSPEGNVSAAGAFVSIAIDFIRFRRFLSTSSFWLFEDNFVKVMPQSVQSDFTRTTQEKFTREQHPSLQSVATTIHGIGPIFAHEHSRD